MITYPLVYPSPRLDTNIAIITVQIEGSVVAVVINSMSSLVRVEAQGRTVHQWSWY